MWEPPTDVTINHLYKCVKTIASELAGLRQDLQQQRATPPTLRRYVAYLTSQGQRQDLVFEAHDLTEAWTYVEKQHPTWGIIGIHPSTHDLGTWTTTGERIR